MTKYFVVWKSDKDEILAADDVVVLFTTQGKALIFLDSIFLPTGRIQQLPLAAIRELLRGTAIREYAIDPEVKLGVPVLAVAHPLFTDEN